jgi:hypothetical protein
VDDDNLPVATEAKPSLLEWLADYFGIPFAFPKIALPQTIRNADKALGRLIAAGAENVAGRMERNTAIRAAKKDAEVKAIKAAANQLARQMKADPQLSERALEYTFRDSILKQKNREQVGRLALEHLNATAQAGTDPGPDASSAIDDDWLNAFSDHVSSKSDADIQSLWAKILANEIRKPRSFSLQSLRLLADLSADDARLLHDKILPLAVSEHLIFSPGLADITEFIRAQELGALTGASGVGLTWNVSLRPGTTVMPLIRGALIIEATQEITMPLQGMLLTRFGKELLRLSNDYPPAPDDYIKRLIESIEGLGPKVRRIP